jgi:hypothetical protein
MVNVCFECKQISVRQMDKKNVRRMTIPNKQIDKLRRGITMGHAIYVVKVKIHFSQDTPRFQDHVN